MAENNTESNAEKKSSPIKLVIVLIVGAILLVAVSMGGVFFLMKTMGMGGGGGEHANADQNFSNEPPIYFPLEPPFVVNFKDRGRTRFLQVAMQVMARDPQVIVAIETHMPLIRNNILLVLSNQDSETLHSAEGKELIREQVMAELKTILVQEIGRAGEKVEGLYFTSFVTQ